MVDFVSGQRWISETEVGKGLGVVLSLENRVVRIFFPSVNETRNYAIDNCPLVRIIFSVGDVVESCEGQKILVKSVFEKEGNIFYQGIDAEVESSGVFELPETQLSHTISWHQPQDKLLSGQVDPLSFFSLRYKILLQNYRLKCSSLLGLIGSRTSLIPHQLYVANEVSKRYAPRVMLADEVGMGKTIEAGLIIHHQLISGRAQRVLIVVPDSLKHQWFVEMFRRFNLHFSIFDKSRCNNISEDNSFLSEQLVLCSMEFLIQQQQYANEALAVDWDLLVVDEAHHLVWQEEQPSLEYQLIAKFSACVKGMLLLTATPTQTGSVSHFARLQLLDASRFHCFEQFTQEEKQYQSLASIVDVIKLEQIIDEKNQKKIVQFLGEQSQQLIDIINTGAKELKNDARQKILQQLLDRHGTGRILYRNTREAVGGFPKRVMQSYPLVQPELYQIALENESDVELNIFPEIAYQRNIQVEDTESWWQVDTRIDWLLQLLKLLSPEKILLICKCSNSALDIDSALRVRSGIQSAAFHENMSIVERDRAAAWFADEEYGAQILVCSEIGSEGRNFQFAHHLVLFDLPLHPDQLEQRIGRLDRIGQKETVKIHVPYIEQTKQELLFRWYDQGLNAFTHICPSGSVVFKNQGQQLQQFLSSSCYPDQKEVDLFLEQTVKLNQEVQQDLQQGRDKLLELNSQGAFVDTDLIESLEEYEKNRELKRLSEKMFDSLGVDVEDHSKNSLILKPTNHMTTVIPMLTEEGLTVTFDRNTALSREDVVFLTWEHPMIMDCMETVVSSGMGSTAVCLIKNKGLKTGTTLLEVVFVLQSSGRSNLQLERFLPPTPIRCLIDASFNDLADKVAFDKLNAQLQPVKKPIAKKVIEAQRKLIIEMLKKAQTYAQKQVVSILEESSKKLIDLTNREIERLKALQKVNPNVRLEEIEFFEKQAKYGQKYLQTSKLSTDSIRVMLAG